MSPMIGSAVSGRTGTGESDGGSDDDGVVGRDAIAKHPQEPSFTARDVRGEMERAFPASVQRPLSWITAKPRCGERPLLSVPPLVELGIDVAVLVATVVAATAALSLLPGIVGAALLPPAWIVVVGRLRKLQVTHGHHAAHGVHTGDRRIDRIVLDLATTLPLAQAGDEYRAEHARHHRRRIFSSIQDPDAATLHALGFRPGMRREELWKRLRWTLVSPAFHLMFARARLRSNLIDGPLYRRLLAAAWIAVLCAVALATPGWGFALVVLPAIGPLYHWSSLAQFVSEHGWTMDAEGPATREAYIERCWGRFCADPLPDSALRGVGRWLALAGWWARLLLIHLPARAGVLVGDLPSHDLHHVASWVGHHPLDWQTGNHDRQRAIDDGDLCGLARREIWGLGAAIDRAFACLERAGRTAPAENPASNDA